MGESSSSRRSSPDTAAAPACPVVVKAVLSPSSEFSVSWACSGHTRAFLSVERTIGISGVREDDCQVVRSRDGQAGPVMCRRSAVRPLLGFVGRWVHRVVLGVR